MKEAKDEIFLIQTINSSINKNEVNINFENLTFHFNNSVNIEINEAVSLSFINCNLNGKRIDLTLKKSPTLSFIDSWISCNTFIKDSEIENFKIENCIVEANDFTVTKNKINSTVIIGGKKRINKFNIFQYNYNKTNYFDCRLNVFLVQSYFYKNTFNQIFTYNANISEKLIIESCKFDSDFNFWNNNLGQFNKIEKSKFEKVHSSLTNFGNNTEIENNLFNGNCDFTKIFSGNLVFNNNTFYNTLQFDFSKFISLKFKSVIFKEITSFSNIKFKSNFIFDSSHFEKIAFFENILSNDNPINLLDLNTIRIIKNQLSKYENKIDYKNFYAFEQEKYLQELDVKNPDYYILILNKITNNFGRSWLKGVYFTFISSLLFFIVLIIVNSILKSNYKLIFNYKSDFENFNTILLEYLKFTFSLGFNSPNFQQNGLLYFIYIIGKIFIGIGIYQTIRAFRKFA